MNKLFILFVCLLGLTREIQGQAVTITIDAGQLRGALGTAAEPVGGLLELLASPSGTFSAPTSSSYVTGDNVLLSSFAMNNNAGTAETVNKINSLLLSTSSYTLTVGEQLELRFYPSLTYAAMPTAPTLGTTYGQVRSSTIEFGSAGGDASETTWVVPSSGATIDLDYVTVSNGGTYANTTAYATNVVLAATPIPEPTTYAACVVGLAGLFGLQVRRSRGLARTAI